MEYPLARGECVETRFWEADTACIVLSLLDFTPPGADDRPSGGPMLGLGVPEILFILVLALLLFGPKRLPEIGRTLGKGLNEFRKASNELKRTINTELALDEEEHSHPQPQRTAPSSTAPTVSTPAIAALAATSPEAPAVLAAEAPVDGVTLPPVAPVEFAHPSETAAAASTVQQPGSLDERPLPAGTLARGAHDASTVPTVPSTPAPAAAPVAGGAVGDHGGDGDHGDHHAQASADPTAPVAPIAVTAAPLDPR